MTMCDGAKAECSIRYRRVQRCGVWRYVRVMVLPLALSALMRVAGAAQAPAAFGDAWAWPLSPRLFGELSQPERVQYSRAEDMVRSANYEAAAVEFEKFIAQAPRSPVRPHAVLLQGYCWHLAQKRGRALEIYTEVLDFYSESLDQAVPALFLKANAQFQNGNTEAAIALLEELTANKSYRAHPVCDLALNELARRYVAADRTQQAETCWRAVLEAFVGAFVRPEDAAREAHRNLVDLYIREGRLDPLDKLLAMEIPYTKEKGAVAQAIYAEDRAIATLGQLAPKAQHAFLAWFRDREEVFVRAGAQSEFLSRALNLAARVNAREPWAALLQQAMDFCRVQPGARVVEPAANIASRLSDVTRAGWDVAAPWQTFTTLVTERGDALRTSSQIRLFTAVMDGLNVDVKAGTPPGVLWDILVARLREIYEKLLNPARDEGLAGLVDRLSHKALYDRALDMCTRIETPALAFWKQAGVYESQKVFEKAVEACAHVEEVDSGTLAAQSLRMRARLYKDDLARYDEAIKLFLLINDPPATIWQIVDCHERKGDPKAAVAACGEIENFFEKDAPRAAFRKALVWQNAGNREQTIAEARRVLKIYPGHQVASQAHQLLERYGIATGGGIIDEE